MEGKGAGGNGPILVVGEDGVEDGDGTAHPLGLGGTADLRTGGGAEVVHGIVDGHAVAAPGGGGVPGHRVRQGGEAAAVDVAVGVQAVRLDFQLPLGVVPLQMGQGNVEGGHKGPLVAPIDPLTVKIHPESSPPPPAR